MYLHINLLLNLFTSCVHNTRTPYTPTVRLYTIYLSAYTVGGGDTYNI